MKKLINCWIDKILSSNPNCPFLKQFPKKILEPTNSISVLLSFGFHSVLLSFEFHFPIKFRSFVLLNSISIPCLQIWILFISKFKQIKPSLILHLPKLQFTNLLTSFTFFFQTLKNVYFYQQQHSRTIGMREKNGMETLSWSYEHAQ